MKKSTRERVAELHDRGLLNSEIAGALRISPQRVSVVLKDLGRSPNRPDDDATPIRKVAHT